MKVENQKERIQRKQKELALYQDIIGQTFSFMKQRIDENKTKQELVT